MCTLRARSLVSLAALSFIPAVASAGDDHRFGTYRRDDRRHHQYRYDHRHDHRDRDHGGIDIEIHRGGSAPVHSERVWVEPVYRTVIDRVWVEPVTRTVHERVWVPARYEWRESVCYERGRRIVRREYVIVEFAHYEDVCREVVVAPGYWKECPRQELVTPGTWVERCDPRPVESHARIDLRIPIRW